MNRESVILTTGLDARDMGENLKEGLYLKNESLRCQVGRFWAKGGPNQTFELVAHGSTWDNAYEMWKKRNQR